MSGSLYIKRDSIVAPLLSNNNWTLTPEAEAAAKFINKLAWEKRVRVEFLRGDNVLFHAGHKHTIKVAKKALKNVAAFKGWTIDKILKYEND